MKISHHAAVAAGLKIYAVGPGWVLMASEALRCKGSVYACVL
jgi:hypothetical protein